MFYLITSKREKHICIPILTTFNRLVKSIAFTVVNTVNTIISINNDRNSTGK